METSGGTGGRAQELPPSWLTARDIAETKPTATQVREAQLTCSETTRALRERRDLGPASRRLRDAPGDTNPNGKVLAEIAGGERGDHRHGAE